MIASSHTLRKSALVALAIASAGSLFGFTLPDLPPMPAIPARQPQNSVSMGRADTFSEVKMDFPMETGSFAPTWSSIIQNYPTHDSAWLRKAKFGIWVHFGPQAAGNSGDWYARLMYISGQNAYNYNVNHYGYPPILTGTTGYKDFLLRWNPSAFSPADLTNTYFNAGARYLLIQGVHHDQYDNWNSKYQDWNCMNFGTKRDLLKEWRDAIRAKPDMHFGVTFHHEYTWWWWQSCYRADTSGTLYDGNLTNDPSTSTWTYPYIDPLTSGTTLKQMDLRKLYTINLSEYKEIYGSMNTGNWYNLSSGIFSNHLDFAHWYATWWALRIQDVIENYDPDFIYTDGNSTQPFSGDMSGSGYKCDAMQRVLAHYFNRTMERRGSLDTFGIVKFNPNNRGIVNTFENNWPSRIKTDQPWIGEVPVGDWFYASGFNYNPSIIIRYLLECVSRDGAVAICIALKSDGSLDPGSVSQLQGVGAWMKTNGAGIYGSHAWVVFGEGTNNLPMGKLHNGQANATFTTSDFRYTVGEDGYLYAYCMADPSGKQLSLKSLGTNSSNPMTGRNLAGPVGSVELLGGTSALTFTQSGSDLSFTCPTISSFQTAACFKIGPPSIVPVQTPTAVAANYGANAVSLTWNTAEPTATFTIKRATNCNGPYSIIASGVTDNRYTDLTPLSGTSNYYTVTAVSGSGTLSSSDSPSYSKSWISKDIGAVGATGSLLETGSLMIVKGSGADIWYSADEFRYVSKALAGDGTITAKVESMDNTAPWAKAGVMIRESLNADSKYAITFMSPTNGIALQQRTSTGVGATGVSGIAGFTAPYWVRLVRSGNTFTSYRSPDGSTSTWTATGTTTIAMNTNVYAGLAVCSVADGTLCSAVFSNVSISGSTGPDAAASLAAVVGDGTATLNWTPSAGASSYTLKQATDPSGPFSTVSTGLTGTSCVTSGLTSGSTYYYTVTAVNAAGSSADSAPISVTPVTPAMAWRQAHFGTILSTGSAADDADPDGDGLTNAQEFIAGTDPNDATSCLKVSQLQPSAGDMVVQFSTVSGKKYRVETSDTLQSGSWTPVQDNIDGTGGVVQVTDPAGAGHAKRFYRIVVK